jgi:uncharacterized protein (UPF0335 family)
MVNGVFAADQLKLFVERIERLEEEKKNIGEDIRDVFAEAKANGFDPKIMRKCITLRKQPSQQRDEEEALLDTYKRALGLKSFDDTPLGKAAAEEEETPPSEEQTEAPPQAKPGKPARPISHSMSTVPLGEEPKPKRGRPRKVRDPSDGTLVTIPANETQAQAEVA